MRNPTFGHRRGTWAVVVLALMLAGPALDLLQAGGAARTRPGGSSRGSAGGGGRGSRPQHASGKATYGYGGHHHGHGGHWGYYGYYGSYGYPYFGFSYWPYWGWYAPPYVVLSRPTGATPGTVETDVKPGKAALEVDGQLVGQARDFNGKWKQLLWLEPGDHMLEFSRPGYQTLRRLVKLRPGEYVRVADRLQKGEGIDPRSTEKPPAPPVDEERAGTAIRSAPAVTAEAGEPGSLRRGLLRLDVRPADAAVYLDGEFLAQAGELSRLHGAIPVAQGVHAIEVVRPGYESRSVDVEIASDEPVKLTVELERR